VWNVLGLNAKAHHDAVRELVVAEQPSLVCLQETKLVVITMFYVMQNLGPGLDYVSHYIRNSNQKHGLNTCAKVIVSYLEK
jgi:exonuclease III